MMNLGLKEALWLTDWDVLVEETPGWAEIRVVRLTYAT